MPRFLPEIRPSERRDAVVATGTLFLILAGFVMVDTARDALFLAELPPGRLPWMYLAIAAASMAIAVRAGHWGRGALAAWLLTSAGITAGFWPLVTFGAPALYGLYVWAGVFATLAVSRFWLLLGQRFTVTEAKRLYGLVGAGSLVGAVAGAGVARLLTEHLPTRHLLLGSAATLALSAVGPLLLTRSGSADPADEARPDLRRCLRAVTAHPFVGRLGLLVVLSTLTLKLVDWIFMAQVDAHVADADLGRFFSDVYVGLNVLGLLAQLTLTGFALRVLGVQRAVLLFPMLLVLAATGVVMGGGLAAALVLLALDGSLKHSIHRTALELLYLPVPGHLRRHAKDFFDIIGHRGGQALASVGILAVVALGGGPVWIAVAVVGLAVVWIAVGLGLREPYLELFRSTLREGSIETRGAMPELDLVSLEALIRALNSPDDEEVRAAMDLLARADRVDLIPALILHHPSEAIVERALELFSDAGRRDFLPLADRLVDHGSRRIRVAAVRSSLHRGVDPARLRSLLDDSDPAMRATASVGLIACGGAVDAERAGRLEALSGAEPEARRAAASAVARCPDPAFEPLLLRLAHDGIPEVRTEAARAMGVIRTPGCLDTLVGLLGHRTTREAAREALLRYGDRALGPLEGALRDPAVAPQVRSHIPRTLSRFAPGEAARVLLEHLPNELSARVRYKILRGVGRLKADDPNLPLPRRHVEEALRLELRGACQLLAWQAGLEQGARAEASRATLGHELLTGLVRDKLSHGLERVFRLLGLFYPEEDLERLYHGLVGDARARSSSVELLEHVVEAPFRQPILALVGDRSPAEGLETAGSWAPAPASGYEELLSTMLAQADGSLRSLCAYHAAELGLEGLLPRIEALERDSGAADPVVRDVLVRAVEILRGAARRQAHAR